MIACCAFIAPLALAGTNVLTFEDLPAGTTVKDQYLKQGVRFYSAYLATDRAARSGSRVLRTISPSAEVFKPIPLRMNFTRPQARVKLFATSPGIARNGTLRAFDAKGALVVQDGPKLVTADRFTTMFEVSLSAARISRAELQLEGASHYAIDDLEFDTNPTLPTPPTRADVRVIETRQPSAGDNPSATGKFPTAFRLALPAEHASNPALDTDSGPEKSLDIEAAPVVEKVLKRGETAELMTNVTAAVGLAGSVRWTGTSTSLPVTLSLNGSQLAYGKSYVGGVDRGGADVIGFAKTAGQVRLSVTNIYPGRVKVILTLGSLKGRVK